MRRERVRAVSDPVGEDLEVDGEFVGDVGEIL